MDLQRVCEALTATQQPDGEARKQAEELLDKAAAEAPNQLVAALCAVLKASPMEVADSIRQEAAVILRQLVLGLAHRDAVWDSLEDETKVAAKAQILATVGSDPSNLVRRAAGQVITAVVNSEVDDFDELQEKWRELLPALSQLTASGTEAAVRVIAVGMLKDMVTTIGDGFFEDANRASLMGMLASVLGDQAPEVRAAGAQLVLSMVEALSEELLLHPAEGETTAPLVQVMPEVVRVVQGFANNTNEEVLKETLEVLIQAAEAEASFFKESGCLKELSETLLKIASVGAQAFSVEDVRHSAMEAVMVLAVNLVEDVSKPEGHLLLEALTILNVDWMTEVEEDVDTWTKEGKDTDEDECDDAVVGIGEENLDRLAQTFDEDVYMPILFKVIRGALQRPDASWKTVRSTIMCLAQVVEHLEDEDWVNQCVEFVMQHLEHAHPRVRYAAFWAVSQVCYDQSPHVQEKYSDRLLPAIVSGINDANIRVATSSVTAFVALGEELEDSTDLEEHMDDLLQRFFNRLHAGESQALQEQCLGGIAVIAEVCDKEFAPYYSRVMPMLKQVINSCTKDEQRSLQGKAFECVSLIGDAVGKEVFLPDAKEVMEVMLPMAREGFDADDPRQEAWHEAVGKIAETLGKDFKPYVDALLPGIFKVLQQRPAEAAALDDDSDDESLDDNLRMYGLKTRVVEEMQEALELTDTLIEALGEEFSDFMPTTCQHLLAFLDMKLSDSLREKAFKTWECLAGCARSAVVSGRLDGSALRELVTEFLKKTVGAMMSAAGSASSADEALCSELQLQASGLAGVVRKAGEGVLTKDGVKDVAAVIVKMLDSLPCAQDLPAEPGVRRRRGGPAPDDDSDGEKDIEDEVPVSAQSVRFSLCDVAGALMRANRDDFCEVALPTFMELVKSLVRADRSEGDRSLGFYIADDVVSCLGEKSVPFWNGFMNEALTSILDKSSIVRQYAASTVGNASTQAAFGAAVPAAASSIHKVLTKQGERHRRRRAVKADALQTALAVDASIRALGQICEHHEQQMGADAPTAWSLWTSNLPIKYCQDAGKAAHAQLVDLVLKNHAMLTSPASMPRVLSIFADIWKSKFSTSELDTRIVQAISSLSEETLAALGSGLSERHQKKVEQMVKSVGEDS